MTYRRSWALLVLFVLMAALQLTIAARQCLWGDELFSLALATGHSLEQPAAKSNVAAGDFVQPPRPVSPEQLQRYLKHEHPPAGLARVVRAVYLSDTSPPLYYILLYGWTILAGTSDFAARCFSVLWSLASFPLMASVTRRTAGTKALIPSCALFAFSPIGTYFGTEARMYSLLIFLVLATAWATLRLQQQPGPAWAYFLWIAASAAGFLTHYFFLFPWMAMVAFVLLRPGSFRRAALIGCVALAMLAISPWYVHVPDSLARWRITGGWLHMRPSEYHALRATRNHFLQFFSGGGSGLWPYSAWSARSASLLFAIVFAAMIWRLRSRLFGETRLLLWLWFIAACCAPSIMDALQHTYLANNPRYTLAALPAAYLLAALALTEVPRRVSLVALVLILLAWSAPIAKICRQHWRNSQPLCQIVPVLQAQATAADVVLVHSIPSGVLGIARYAHSPLRIASWIEQLGRRRVQESLPALIGGRKRVFFVKLHLLGEPLPEEDWLRAHAEVVQQKRMQEIWLIEFRPKNSATFQSFSAAASRGFPPNKYWRSRTKRCTFTRPQPCARRGATEPNLL
ncbi:MAG: glycosyltransferase family 39 protein [Verrucomicrobia bacterium]|nr:glycosyltransferase family 39 protein [Verrucomicrobiota bacterium]